MLLFKKADVERDHLKISKLDAVELCRDVYLSFTQQARAKNISFHFESGLENAFIFVDREKMEIVLFNLISNAIKYTPDGGSILFNLTEQSDTVTICVKDDGPGIPKEVGNRLFEKYYRVPSSSGKSKSGFGIGLYLAKLFVEAHEGHISYKSELNFGAAFFIELKKGIEHLNNTNIYTEQTEKSGLLQELIEEPLQIEGSKQLDAVVSERRSILVIEDDEQLRKYVKSIFDHNFVMYEACSSTEGLKLATKNSPDIIICDIALEESLSGIELCKSIKESSALSHIPFILLTGSASSAIKLKGVENGADDYITKPFEKDLLIARVSSLLKNRNVLQNYFYNEITLQKNTLKVSEEYKAFLENCIKIVEQHLDNDQFSIQTLASEVGMSHSALYKKVKSISGQSVNGFIRFIRLRRAAELLLTTDCNINEAAYKVGINDIKYFRTQFNKLFNMNPSEYVKKFRKPFSESFTLSKNITKGSE